MRTLLPTLMFLFTLPSLAWAQAPAVGLKLRPARSIEIVCIQGGNRVSTSIHGSSDQLTVLRVGESGVKYEIYSDGFLQASCESIEVQNP